MALNHLFRSLIIGSILIFGAHTLARPAEAQGPPPMGGMSAADTLNVRQYDTSRELKRLVSKYKLTADEQSAIRPLLDDQQKRIHALGEDKSLTDAEWVAAVRRVHQETVQKVRQQLSESQSLRYAADEEKRARSDAASDADQGPPDGPPPGGPPPGGGGPPM